MHKARKRFGQHFLHDNNIIEKILRSIAISDSDLLLEIGPGQGALTFPLLAQCKKLIAVELDRDLIPILNKKSNGVGELTIINEDVLNFQLDSLPGEKPYRVVGNLPYNISTPLMFHLLDSINRIQDMHFMVQKEVALRIVADVGSQHYGRLSIMIQNLCKCQYLFDVGPESFTPPPRVDSAIIRLLPRAKPAFDAGDFELFSQLVLNAFGQRRKTISNSLKAFVSSEIFELAGVNKKLRAENLSGHDFASLTRAILNRSTNA